MLKKIGYLFSVLIVVIVIFVYWLITTLSFDQRIGNIQAINPQDLNYINQEITTSRGKILTIITSESTMGVSGKKTGYELTELARAYYIFTRNGFDVNIASPKGGLPTAVIDKDDMNEFDYAFLNDESAQYKVKNSLVVDNINVDEYVAVYFVGGKGAMFDFLNNQAIQRIIKNMYENDKVIAAICHGPAALVNVVLNNGEYLLDKKRVSSFTNDEETFLIPNASTIFPFLLESKLRERGASFTQGQAYLEQITHDENLITGQNAWSVFKTAEIVVKQLGYQPIFREKTATENTNQIISNYYRNGFSMAGSQLQTLMINNVSVKVDRRFLFTHSFVAFVKGDISDGIQLLRLLHLTRL